MSRIQTVCAVAALSLGFGAAACKGEPTQAQRDPAQPDPAQNAPAPPLTPMPELPSMPSMPTMPAQAAGAAPVSGKILETMDAATYTYLKLATSQGETWAAVPKAKVAVGDTVTVENATVMQGFESPTLHRKFDTILFGTLGGAAGRAASAYPAATGASSANAAGAVTAVPKATGPNAHTIAEIFADKTLKDKPVTVRGTVTKYNGGILQRNWLHIDDGSRKQPGDNTLVVTTNDTANVGDVVLVSGTVHTDKDFGAGYSYPVLIEDATLSK